MPILKMLLARNDTDVSLQDNDGRTPLHIAVQAKSMDIIELLMERNDVDLTLTDNNGMAPLQLAGNNTQIVTLLTNQMSDSNSTEIVRPTTDEEPAMSSDAGSSRIN